MGLHILNIHQYVNFNLKEPKIQKITYNDYYEYFIKMDYIKQILEDYVVAYRK